MGGQVLGPKAPERADSRRARRKVEVCLAVALAVASALGLAPPARALYGPSSPADAGWRAVWVPGVTTTPGTPGPAADLPATSGAVAPGLPAARGTVPTVDRGDGPAAADRSLPRGRWAWPLVPRPAVIARFRAPSTAYGPGHRGVDLAATVGASVNAVAGGRVSFAGVIGGKPTVAVTHADGIRSTYEPVLAMVAVGDRVVVGQRLGTVAAAGSHCTTTCVHLGAIRGTTYLDPLRLLGWWRVRLLPLEPPG